MARNVQIGNDVYVPVSRIAEVQNAPVALKRLRVVGIDGKKVVVEFDGNNTVAVAMSLVHLNVGILLVLIGDFETETTLLEPLAKSVLQFCRLLLPDDQVTLLRIRTINELKVFWNKHHAVYSHVILIGHGRQDSIRFSVSGWRSGADLGDAFSPSAVVKKNFVSLCCSTGYADFGREFSSALACGSLVAPFQSVHGAVASQYCQVYLTSHFLYGCSAGVAHAQARDALSGTASFRFWKSGKLRKTS